MRLILLALLFSLSWSQETQQASKCGNNGSVVNNGRLPGAKASFYCTIETPCTGDMTYYYPSIDVGACGYKDKISQSIYTNSDDVVALSPGMMGDLSSGVPINPLCRRSINILNPATGKNATGIVVDKCAGCVS